MAANPGRGGANANPGGGAGAGNNGPMGANAEHVEFSVKAEEDLFLTGTETTIRRVTAETNYSCLMLKTQRFSSLFRHYAKYHGLRKDDLEYYFVNLLENEDTPESVQLQRGDTIMVRKRRKPEPPEVAADDDDFFTDMKELLYDEEHMDVVFLIHPLSSSSIYHSFNNMTDLKITRNISDNIYSNNQKQVSAIIGDYKSDDMDPSGVMMDTGTSANTSTAMLQTISSPMVMDEPATASQPSMIQIRAHKSVLTARAEYFKSFFRTNAANSTNTKVSVVVGNDGSATIPTGDTNNLAFKESKEATVNVDAMFNELHIRMALEFIYTNRVASLHKLPADEVLSILHLSDMWLLRDLKRICEHELIRSHLTVQTVARLYGATEAFNAKRLARACVEFIMSNLRHVTGSPEFLEEMKHFPHLMLPVLKAAADLIPEGPVHKKQRTVTAVSTPHNVTSSMHDSHSVAAAAAAAAAAAHAGSPPSAAAAAVGVASFRSSPVPDSDA